MGNLSQKYISNKAADKFFNILDNNKSISWFSFDAAVNNFNS